MFSVSVTEPAPHATHCVCPANACTRPDGHATHGDAALLSPNTAAAATSSSYCPAVHAVHTVDATAACVPAGQDAHAVVETLLNCPAGQSEHNVAPVPERVLVADPAAQ
jgi:hypothetical protein